MNDCRPYVRPVHIWSLLRRASIRNVSGCASVWTRRRHAGCTTLLSTRCYCPTCPRSLTEVCWLCGCVNLTHARDEHAQSRHTLSNTHAHTHTHTHTHTLTLSLSASWQRASLYPPKHTNMDTHSLCLILSIDLSHLVHLLLRASFVFVKFVYMRPELIHKVCWG